MAEWATSKAQQKKEARARRAPAWEAAADEAFVRSGAAFMMADGLARSAPATRCSLVVLSGIPGSTQAVRDLGMKE